MPVAIKATALSKIFSFFTKYPVMHDCNMINAAKIPTIMSTDTIGCVKSSLTAGQNMIINGKIKPATPTLAASTAVLI